MHEDRIHGPTIDPAHIPPRACGPGCGDAISAGGDHAGNPPLLPEDGNESGEATHSLPRAAWPRGAGEACSHLHSCLALRASHLPIVRGARCCNTFLCRDHKTTWPCRPSSTRGKSYRSAELEASLFISSSTQLRRAWIRIFWFCNPCFYIS